MVLLIFSLFVVKDSFLFHFGHETVDSVPIRFNVIDYTQNGKILFLTKHGIIQIDSSLTGTVHPLPKQYQELKWYSHIFLLSPDEVLILAPESLTTIDAIALREGDYHLLGEARDRLYILESGIDTRRITALSLSSGKRVARRTFYDLDSAWILPDRIVIRRDTALMICDLNLKNERNIARISKSTKVFPYQDGILICDGGRLEVYGYGGEIRSRASVRKYLIRPGSRFLIGFDRERLMVVRGPGFRPFILRLSRPIDDAYPDGDIYLWMGGYYRLDPIARKLYRLRIPVPTIVASDSGYYLQVGSFTRPENARRLYQELLSQGLPVHRFDNKIRIGPFANRADAVEFAQFLPLNDYWVVREQKQPITGLKIGMKRYLPIIGKGGITIYRLSDGLLIPALRVTGSYTTYLNQDRDGDGRRDLVLISGEGVEVVEEEGDSLIIRKEER